MVRIFVFVSGIALGQFSSQADKPTYVLMARGQHVAVAGEPERLHTAKIVHGAPQVEVKGDGTPRIVELTAGCDGSCPATTPPQNIASLDELLDQAQGKLTVRPACLDAESLKAPSGTAGRCEDGEGMPLVNAHITFHGPWRAGSAIDCGTSYPAPGSPPLSTLTFDGISAGPASGSHQLGNSMVFFADVPDSGLATVLKVDGKAVELQALDKVGDNLPCSRLGGFGAPSRCAVVAIRNVAEGLDVLSHTDDPKADPHFAALYSLLELDHQPVAATGKPIPRVVTDTCAGPTGVGPLGGCIGGYVGP